MQIIRLVYPYTDAQLRFNLALSLDPGDPLVRQIQDTLVVVKLAHRPMIEWFRRVHLDVTLNEEYEAVEVAELVYSNPHVLQVLMVFVGKAVIIPMSTLHRLTITDTDMSQDQFDYIQYNLFRLKTLTVSNRYIGNLRVNAAHTMWNKLLLTNYRLDLESLPPITHLQLFNCSIEDLEILPLHLLKYLVVNDLDWGLHYIWHLILALQDRLRILRLGEFKQNSPDFSLMIQELVDINRAHKLHLQYSPKAKFLCPYPLRELGLKACQDLIVGRNLRRICLETLVIRESNMDFFGRCPQLRSLQINELECHCDLATLSVPPTGNDVSILGLSLTSTAAFSWERLQLPENLHTLRLRNVGLKSSTELRIPSEVSVIDLSNNHLTECEDFLRYEKLHTLLLRNNCLSMATIIAPNLCVLDVDMNELQQLVVTKLVTDLSVLLALDCISNIDLWDEHDLDFFELLMDSIVTLPQKLTRFQLMTNQTNSLGEVEALVVTRSFGLINTLFPALLESISIGCLQLDMLNTSFETGLHLQHITIAADSIDLRNVDLPSLLQELVLDCDRLVDILTVPREIKRLTIRAYRHLGLHDNSAPNKFFAKFTKLTELTLHCPKLHMLPKSPLQLPAASLERFAFMGPSKAAYFQFLGAKVSQLTHLSMPQVRKWTWASISTSTPGKYSAKHANLRFLTAATMCSLPADEFPECVVAVKTRHGDYTTNKQWCVVGQPRTRIHMIDY
ncbi:hypothetical protein JNB11_02535 [Kocuria palustris]|nr:hypothetical protein [Kocuria palustris]